MKRTALTLVAVVCVFDVGVAVCWAWFKRAHGMGWQV